MLHPGSGVQSMSLGFSCSDTWRSCSQTALSSPFCCACAAAVFWVLCAELFSMGVKAPATSAAMAVLFASGAAANLVFLTLHSWLHSAAFLVFAAIAGPLLYLCHS